MRAVVITRPGGVEVLEIQDVPRPEASEGEILVRNFAAGLNRADLLQRRGLYPPPAGESTIPGLEFAGEVAALGPGTSGFRTGDRVFGIVAGGAQADFLRVDARTALPIPDRVSFDAAGAIPEAFFTALEVLTTSAGLLPGETVLVHAGASGVGSAAIQLAHSMGARVFATAGSAPKLEKCRALGAERAIHRKEEDFARVVGESTGGRGVDVVVDLVGAPYWERNLASLAEGGRLVSVGFLGGSRVNLDLLRVLQGRLRIVGTVLRSRSREDKAAISLRFRTEVLPLIESGRLRAVIDSVLPLEDVRAGHERLESNANTGKVVLRL